MTVMEKIIDLHTHTLCSDGSMTPTELVHHAKASGLTAVAVSDHDTMDGVKEAMAAGREIGVEVVPAIELSAISDTETHILGYFIDPDSEVLAAAVDNIRAIRTQRIGETCEMLEKYNIHVTLDEVKAKAGGGILCRAHIAKLMTEKGYSESPKAAFNEWLNVGCPCYSESQALTDTEAVELIRKAGGDAYLAHLHLTKKSGGDLENFVKHLVDAGLTGVEGYYTDYTPEMAQTYRDLAKKYGLKISGGTDFHGSFKPHISIGRGLGDMVIPYSVLENMKAGRE
ncbi:MAG: PHP domain-containing protein [Ruminococcaceae bacterium]|nr:PHP domain-containing protein [Oscillospiraceae bacterium]